MLIVYHRHPSFSNSPNGIMPVLQNIQSKWLSWTTNPNDSTNVFLTEKQVTEFYNVICKGSLWPLLHGFRNQLGPDAWEHWDTFCNVNRRFAEYVSSHHETENTVWIHDYNLILMPLYLRQTGYKGTISFFFHTAVPSCDEFQAIPEWRALMTSLLACSIVGVHVPRYANNLGQLARCMGCEVSSVTANTNLFQGKNSDLFDPYVTCQMKNTRVVAFPMPLGKSKREERIFPSVNTSQKKRVLCFSRIDYIKNPCGVLRMFDTMLSMYPKETDRVELWFGCTGSKSATYKAIQTEVNYLTKSLSERYPGTFRYFQNGLSRGELFQAMKNTDVCVIPSFRDGLNLVAKEFVNMAKNDAVLLLSSFTGASVEMRHPILFQPYDSLRKLARQLYTCLFVMSESEKKQRMASLKYQVESVSISEWVQAMTE